MFIEAPYHKGALPDIDASFESPLIKIVNVDLRDCLSQDKSVCKYKNARFHYSDPRGFNIFRILWLRTQSMYDAVRKGDVPIAISSKWINYFEQFEADGINFSSAIISFYANLLAGNDITKSLLYKYGDTIKLSESKPLFEHIGKISKQLKNIPDLMRKDLYEALSNRVLLKLGNLDWQDILNEMKNPTNMIKLKQIKQLFEYLSYSIMDIYLLARMFRNFNPSSKVKIIYAGAAHCEFYINFLTKYMGYEIDYYKSDLRKKCLNIHVALLQ